MAKSLRYGVVVVVIAVLAGSCGCSSRRSGSDSRPSAVSPRTAAGEMAPPAAAVPAPPPDDADGPMAAARSRVAEDLLVEGPWTGAAAGDFVKYRAADDMEMVYKVLKSDNDNVTLDMTVTVGKDTFTQQVVQPLLMPARQSAFGVPASARWSQAELTVAGKSVPCRLATWKTSSRGHIRTRQVYVSDQVPGKMVRAVEIDEAGRQTVSLELLDFARARP